MSFKKILFIIFICFSGVAFSKDIGTLFRTCNTDHKYASYIQISASEKIRKSQIESWIKRNKSFFAYTDSIKITHTDEWKYGANRYIVTRVDFIMASNKSKRIEYFEEIIRRKEQERLAQIKRLEDESKQEQERLLAIQKSIENGTFTGKHYYFYPEGKYEGNFVNGKREGYGKLSLKSNGEWYEGYFKNEEYHGIGTFRKSSGVRYTGEFINGKQEGKFNATYWNLLFFEYETWTEVYKGGSLISSNRKEKAIHNNSDGYQILTGNLTNPSVKHYPKDGGYTIVEVIDGGTFSSNVNENNYSTLVYDKNGKIIQSIYSPFEDNSINIDPYAQLPVRIVINYEIYNEYKLVEILIKEHGRYRISIQ